MSANRQDDKWKFIGEVVLVDYREYHSKAARMTIKNRIRGIHESFVDLLKFVWGRDQEEIKQYIEKRKPEDEKLQKVQHKVKPEIKKMLDIDPIPASSFTAGTNILGDSDLDFNIPVPDMNLRKLLILATKCGNYGYEFADIRNEGLPGVNYVFSKFVDGVEIEVKLNNAVPYMEVMDKVHDYLDHQMPKERKQTIAWIKQHFKDLTKKRANTEEAKAAVELAKQQYKEFKALYYEHALYPMKLDEMMYPLK
jgi:hypothetical protein